MREIKPKVGQVVHLNSDRYGRHLMTVARLEGSTAVETAWITAEGDLKTAVFPIEMLSVKRKTR